MAEENAITITENKREKVIEKNELKVKEGIIIETKLQDELIVPKDRKMEPPTKNESIPSIPSPRPEETLVEVKAPMEPVAKLPTLTKEEISVDMEPPTAVSIENFFQAPTIPVKEDLKSVTVPSTEPVPYKIEIEKTEIGEETQAKQIVHDTKEVEISQVTKIKENAEFEDLIDKKLAIETVNDKKINSTDKEKALIVQEIEKKEEIISDHVKRNEKKVEDVPVKEAVIEKEKAVVEVRINKRLPVSEEIDESKHEEDAVEKLKEIPQVDKVADREEARNAEIVETEISEVSPVVKTKIEQDVEEALPKVDVTEITKITPEIVSPIVDLIEIEKIEPSELPIVDVEKVSVSDIVEKKITLEEPPPIVNAKEELLILNAITEEKVKIEEPSITDIIQKEIEIEEVPTITDIVKEIIEIKEPTEEIITEKKIEIQPVTEPPIQEIEEIKTTKQPVPEAEIKKEKDEEMPEKVTPPIKLFEEREREEIPESAEKEEISVKIALPTKLTVEDKKEKSVEEKKPELVEIESKIPIAEIKPDEIEVPAIPIDPRILAQPYLIIAKIKEKELLQIVPAMKLPCTECCSVSKNHLHSFISSQ